ncbi:lipoyl amidotransferase LIPT1, mitochondrial-like [Glandiceps talaboti]
MGIVKRIWNLSYVQRCLYSTKPRRRGMVYCSLSNDVYTNLAFEDWAYENWTFEDIYLLLLWRNDPCVVIGRHQNPWMECNIPKLQTEDIKLARRKSGGGTVYHDMGNLNITFFTPRKMYDRHLNLEFIMRTLKTTWPHLDVKLSPRDDLMLDAKYKISGSAAKLGRNNAYHHCTLLFDADTSLLHNILHANTDGIDSKATESVRSKVRNLSEVEPAITYKSLVEAFGREFYECNPPSHNAKIYEFNPLDEQSYPKVGEIKEDLKKWNWKYGFTPKFAVTARFGELSVCFQTKNGLIQDVIINGQEPWLNEVSRSQIVQNLQNIRYWHADLVRALLPLKSTTQSSGERQELNELLDKICEMARDHR